MKGCIDLKIYSVIEKFEHSSIIQIMNVVISIDMTESCIHNYLCISVNLCPNFQIIGLLRKF